MAAARTAAGDRAGALTSRARAGHAESHLGLGRRWPGRRRRLLQE